MLDCLNDHRPGLVVETQEALHAQQAVSVKLAIRESQSAKDANSTARSTRTERTENDRTS